MRFRKSIKLFKGVKLNLSGSGPTLTLGGRGLSFNVGKNGISTSYGLAGTGIYDRKQLVSFNKDKKKQESKKRLKKSFNNNLELDIDKIGNVSIYSDGKLITDTREINSIKRTDEYKILLKDTLASLKEQYDIENSFIDDLEFQVQHIFSKDELINLYKNNIEDEFKEVKPNLDEIRQNLEKEAKEKVSTILFWRKKQLINEYVNERLSKTYETLLKEYEEKKERYNKLKQEYLSVTKNIALIEKNDENYLNKHIEEALASIEVPFDFDCQFQIIDKTIYVDLDLPEIEDLPQEKFVVLATKYKLTNKTKKELSQEYYDLVSLLTLVVATSILEYLFNIENIVVSAYTQRRNNKGVLDDQYIFSVDIDRNKLKRFKKENYNTIFNSFYSILKQDSNGILKKIDPIDVK